MNEDTYYDRKQVPTIQSYGILRIIAGTFASVYACSHFTSALSDWAMHHGRHEDIHFPRPVFSMVFHLGWPILSALDFSRESKRDL